MRRYGLVVLFGAVALAGCRQPRTEVMLAIDTDLEVPREIDRVHVDIVGPGGVPREATLDLRSGDQLPGTLAVVDGTGRGGSVRVTVTGLVRGANVLQRRATFEFVPRETRTLWLHLLRGCVGVSCGFADETCGDNGCRSVAIDPSELMPYDPDAIDRRDGGPDGSTGDGGCVPQLEQCNARDDDCDRRVDEDFDLQRDMRHCGGCDVACPQTPDNASSTCAAGACRLHCDPGYDDCDGDIADGCETSIATASDCGRCGNRCPSGAPLCEETDAGFTCVAACGAGTTECSGACVDVTSDPMFCGGCGTRCPAPPNAVATCVESACEFRCDEGFANCDGAPQNGCESNLRELAHCGACGRRCDLPGAVSSCEAGSCVPVACDLLRGDCDGDPMNGCEEDLAKNPERCGACTNACVRSPANGASSCAAGVCQLTCASGYGNCDNNASNGCEERLDTPANCGGCGILCDGGTPLCESTGTGFRCSAACSGTTCGSSCVDMNSDPNHCGGCDSPCPIQANSQPTCVGGQCGAVCLPGFGDCDRSAATGCEQSLTSATDCSVCDNVCPSPPNTVPTCRAGACGTECVAGWGDCNAAAGCETDLETNAMNCGACANRCMMGMHVSAVACIAAVCQITGCDAPHRMDCDANPANGCEANIRSDEDHCGGCGIACAASQRCCQSECQPRNSC